MNRGLLAKTTREAWPITLFCGLGLALAEATMAYALLGFEEQISAAWSAFGLFQEIVRTVLGADMREQIGPETIAAIAWVHPLVLALVWAQPMVYCTRVPAGEVDRGTIDVLLGLPVARWQLYLTETVVWLAAGIVILFAAGTGNALGTAAAGGRAVRAARLALVMANLFALYIAVGGLAWLVSALSDRRGRALTVLFGAAVASFLVQYLAQFWSLAARISFLDLLHYYRPLSILQSGAWPARDIAVLLLVGTALWALAGAIFARRDLATV